MVLGCGYAWVDMAREERGGRELVGIAGNVVHEVSVCSFRRRARKWGGTEEKGEEEGEEDKYTHANTGAKRC
jgi:hypothetical protein